MDQTELLEFAAKHSGKYLVSFGFYDEDLIEKMLNTMPFLDLEEDTQIISDGFGVASFDSEEHAMEFFSKIECDSPKEGHIPVYALLIGPEGILSENT